MRFLLLPILLLSIVCGPVIAQEKQKNRTCRILFLEGPDSAPNTLHLFDGTQSQQVELPRLNLSPVYQLPSGNLTLSLLPDPPADPAKLPNGAPSVKVPEAVADFYLLITSDPANQVAPVSMRVINPGMERLRPGQMLWFNLTEHQIAGRIGTRKLSMQGRSSVTLEAPATGPDDYPVDLAYRLAGNDAVYPICETKWRHDPRSSSLAFVFAKPGIRTPRVLVFPDFRHDENAAGSDRE